VDTTDLPLHGKQEGRFFHGYYDQYCYLPLYIFCGDQALCTRLREANHDASFGSLLKSGESWGRFGGVPEVKIILRGDSGFCRNELMSWCESHRVDYVSVWRVTNVAEIIGAAMWSTQQWEDGQPAACFKVQYKTKRRRVGTGSGASWPRPSISIRRTRVS